MFLGLMYQSELSLDGLPSHGLLGSNSTVKCFWDDFTGFV
jgi:hypothetical protein